MPSYLVWPYAYTSRYADVPWPLLFLPMSRLLSADAKPLTHPKSRSQPQQKYPQLLSLALSIVCGLSHNLSVITSHHPLLP